MENLHKVYYKDYFEGTDFNALLSDNEVDSNMVENNNRKLCGNYYTNFKNPMPSLCENQVFKLKIAYPGLVTGVGINHEARVKGEFKLGVHFDYTYGLPVIYGSSVKGVLRNAFILKEENGEIKEYEPYFLNKMSDRKWNKDKIKELFESIFEGKEDRKPKSIYDRDVFFDAVIVKADEKGRILCPDAITPHGGPNRDNPLKSPIPITFLKIAPGCTMEFRFKLVDSFKGKDNEFKAEDKLKLFKEIILTLGVGAKTNVGYGQFEQ